MFRMTLENAEWAPTHKTVARLLHNMERTHHGLRIIRMPDGSTARIERTAAVSRAHHVIKSGEFLDDVLDELFGSWTFDAAEVGFWPCQEVHRARMQGTAGEAEDPATAWDHTDVPVAPSVKTGLKTPERRRAGRAARKAELAPQPAPPASRTPGLARSWRGPCAGGSPRSWGAGEPEGVRPLAGAGGSPLPRPQPRAGPPPKRRVVFVVGSGRSGTSTMSGALQTLGMHVPQPEVGADETNPKGFGEPQWVVDLHTELLQRCNVAVSDARPAAWFEAGKLANIERLRTRLHTWLEEQFAEAERRRASPSSS